MGLPLALLLFCGQAADGVGLETPEGWKRNDHAKQRMTFFIPPDLPKGRDRTVIVHPVIDSSITADAMVDNMVLVMSQGKRVMGDVQKVDGKPTWSTDFQPLGDDVKDPSTAPHKFLTSRVGRGVSSPSQSSTRPRPLGAAGGSGLGTHDSRLRTPPTASGRQFSGGGTKHGPVQYLLLQEAVASFQGGARFPNA